jgi:hypothetical protein
VKKTKKQQNGHRKFVVFTSLVGMLTVTSALLLALAPAPLTPDSSNSLYAVESPQALEPIFATKVAAKRGQWKYIYVRHSRTIEGSAMTLAATANGEMGDHFVIGNGDGALDGEIQVGYRWDQQASATPPPGAAEIDPSCISICLIGDFDSTVPTPVQLRRLSQLVAALQGRFGVPAGQVILVDQPSSAAGIGRYFPTTAFRDQLLP